MNNDLEKKPSVGFIEMENYKLFKKYNFSPREEEGISKAIDSAFSLGKKVGGEELENCSQCIGLRDEMLEEVYKYLLSIEARMAKEQIESDYESGYFEAIDDLAKYINSLKIQ